MNGRRRGPTALAAAILVGLPLAGYLAAPAAAGPVAAPPGTGLAGFNGNAVSAGAQVELLLPGLVPLGDVTQGNFIQASTPYAYSAASTGPQNNGVASPLWPGDAVATAGNAIGTFSPSFPSALIKLLNDPAVARSAYPEQVDAKSSSSFSPSGPANVGTATTNSSAGGGQSSAVINNLAPLGSAKATGTPLIQVASSTSSTLAAVRSRSVTTTADTHIGKITVAGLVTIDNLNTTARAGSDGRRGSHESTFKVGAVKVAGLAASIGPHGITLNKKGLGASLGLVTLANKALKALDKVGVTIHTVSPTSSVHGRSATATSGVIEVKFKDANLPDIGKLLPQAPVPLPSSAGFIVALGLSQATAAATLLPPSVAPATSPPTTPPATSSSGGNQVGSGPTTGGSFPTTPTGPGAISGSAPASNPVVAVPQAATAFGLPVRVAWVVISFLLALLLAGLLLSYANWQLLRGRSP